MSEPEQLSSVAITCMDNTIANEEPLSVSAISVLEMIYLLDKGRLEDFVLNALVEKLLDPDSDLVCMPFDLEIAPFARRISRDQVPGIPDRAIAAGAVYLEMPLITRDRQLRKADIPTIW